MVTQFPQTGPSDQTNFSYQLAPLTLTPVIVGIPQAINTGLRSPGWIVVTNESPYRIQVQIPSSGTTVPVDPQTANKVQLKLGDTVIYVTPTVLLPQASPTSLINFQVYDKDPGPGYPLELTRQASPTYASGSTGYSGTVEMGAAAINDILAVAIFNPANNNRTAQFYKLEYAYTSTPFVTATVHKLTSDPNYPNGGTPPPPQTTRANATQSNLHYTFSNAEVAAPGTELRRIRLGNNIWNAMADSRDSIEVVPGTGVGMFIFSIPDTTTTHVMNAQWTEL